MDGVLIFSKVWGSHSHNTHLPESDVDYLGVYQAHTHTLLGMYPPAETLEGKKPDFQVHEVGKFCTLLMKGNPGIVEMLFTERMFWAHTDFQELMRPENRKMFLTKTAVKQYLGYMQGQLRKLAHGSGLHAKGGTYTTKWAYHIVRLGEDALRIARGREPIVWKEGLELDRLMKIRHGEWNQSMVEHFVTEIVRHIEEAKPWPIPDEGNAAWLNDWLLRVRKDS